MHGAAANPTNPATGDGSALVGWRFSRWLDPYDTAGARLTNPGAVVPTLSRRPLSLLLVGAASAGLLLGSAATAQAAVPKVKLVSLDAALATLPLAHSLPGAVRLVDKDETPLSASLELCPEIFSLAQLEQGGSSGDFPLQAGEATATYEPAHSQTPPAKVAEWEISAVVFHTAKAAATAAAGLVKAEKRCPKSSPPASATNPFSSPFVRAKAAPMTVGGWTGYTTVDQVTMLDLLQGPQPVGTRITQVFLTRGNVMVNLVEQGTIATGTAFRQESWRKTVTNALLAKLDRLQG